MTRDDLDSWRGGLHISNKSLESAGAIAAETFDLVLQPHIVIRCSGAVAVAERRRLPGADRGKCGTRRSVLTGGDGYPLSLVAAAANVNDPLLLEATIDEVVVGRSDPEEVEQHLCLDKGYDNATGESATREAGDVPHIRRIGEEKLDERREKRHPARRWVVQRCGRWLTGCRAILTRTAQRSAIYRGLIELQCVLLWYRRIKRAGELVF